MPKYIINLTGYRVVSTEITIEADNEGEVEAKLAEKLTVNLDGSWDDRSTLDWENHRDIVDIEIADIEQELDEDQCIICKIKYEDGGDGYNGCCPDCADRIYGDKK